MPPRISRLHQSTATPPPCCLHPKPSPFTTTSTHHAATPPESPKYIELPKQVQPHAIRPKWMKGVLPTPRSIIRSQNPRDQRKITTPYLSAMTQYPSRTRTPTSNLHAESLVAHKEKQASHRRQHLRESLLELHRRDTRTVERLNTRSSRIQARNTAARHAPEGEYDRLTSPTAQAFLPPVKTGGVPDPNRSARVDVKRANFERTAREHREKRKAQLHALWTSAEGFVTTQGQLDGAVDEAFDDQGRFDSVSKPGMNIWNKGNPEGVRWLLAEGRGEGQGKSAVAALDRNEEVGRRRLERIAGELTGGKMGSLGKKS